MRMILRLRSGQALRLALALLFVLGLSAGRALAATTAEQLMALSRAGLDDDILIALIQTDGSTFQLTADDLLELHRQGLSNKVIRAMQETAKKPAASAPAPRADAQPDSNTFEARPPEAVVPVAQPIVNVHQSVTQRVEVPAYNSRASYAVPIAVPVWVTGPTLPRPSPPVYWGFGGQRRPDTWAESPKDTAKKDE